MPALETVDLIGVEILSTGGPIHGKGSPPEGDFWSAGDLRAMAAADAELGDEIKPPNKLGHSNVQALLENSGLKPVSPGEMPAIGWVENLRVNDDGSKLLGDVMACPKTAADLIESGAWRTRSVELSKVTSQVTGKVYDWVVTGLAWLGGKMPAVRTLDDVVALYDDAGVALSYQEDGDVELRWIVCYAAGDVVWSPTDGYEALRGAVSEALNGPHDASTCPRFWVSDVTDGKALVEDWESDGDAWVVPFTGTAEAGVEIGERGAWVDAEMAWLEKPKQYAEQLAGRFQRPPDSRPVEPKYTDEQRRTFAETTGLEVEKVTDEVLDKAAETLKVEPAKPDETRNLEADERIKQLEQKVEDTDKRARDLEAELAGERKRVFVEGVLRSGKAEPGQRAEIETMYEDSPGGTKKFFESVKPNDDLSREYGSDEEGDDGEKPTDEEVKERDLAEREHIAREFDIPLEEVA